MENAHTFQKGYKQTEEHKRKIGLANKGDKNRNWKGGIDTKERKKFRNRRQTLKMYGMTFEDYEKLVIEQDSRCAICGIKTENFHIDHCHITNKVRGLLCCKCNPGLGYFSDSVELLEKAIIYLKK